MSDARFILSIPTPCSANWDEMTPTLNGRHCSECRKNVIDFSNMSNNQIVAILKANKNNNICGRLHNSQINTAIEQSDSGHFSSSPILNKAASLILLLQSVATVAIAQNAKSDTLSTQGVPTRNPDNCIFGFVKDHLTQSPVPDILVRISGTDVYAKTDKNGYYRFPLPANVHSGKVIVVAQQRDNMDNWPTGTTILAEEIDVAQLHDSGGVTLFRYPINRNSTANIIYSPPGEMHNYTVGGFTTIIEPRVKKHWFWPFGRKKRKYDK